MIVILASHVLHSSALLLPKQLVSLLVVLPIALFALHQSAARHAIMDLNFLVEHALNYALLPIATLAKPRILARNVLQVLFYPKANLLVTSTAVSMDVPTAVVQQHAPNAIQATH